jgi:hypothetical protein
VSNPAVTRFGSRVDAITFAVKEAVREGRTIAVHESYCAIADGSGDECICVPTIVSEGSPMIIDYTGEGEERHGLKS